MTIERLLSIIEEALASEDGIIDYDRMADNDDEIGVTDIYGNVFFISVSQG